MNNEFSLSNVKRKNSIDSTTSSFKSKRASFRNQPSIINQIKNKNINELLKNNLSRNVKNLPICISQVTNLKNFHQLSTKLSQKDNRNNSLICHSKETFFAKEDSFKDNNKIYNFKSPKQSKNISFNKYISRNRNCLVINDLLLNPSFDNFYKNITPKKKMIKSDKENSALLLKLSPIKLSSIKMPSIIHSPSGNIQNKIKHLKQKYLLNNINNNSTTIDKNLSDINIISNKTKSPEELNALSSFDLYGNNIINSTNNNNIDFKINNTIKNYSNLKRSFNKNKKMNKIIKNKNLFSKMNNSLFEDKNIEKKNFQNKLFNLALNDGKVKQNKKLNKLIFEPKKTAEKKKSQIQSNININERENKEENDSSFFLNKEKSSILQTLKNNWERNNKKQNEITQENNLDKTNNNNLNKTNLNENKTNININNENLNKTDNNNSETLDKSDNNNKILNNTDNNNENSIKKDNNNETLNIEDNNNENKDNKDNNKIDANNVAQDSKNNKSCFNKNKKNENKKLKLNDEEKKSSNSVQKDKNKSKISRKKTFKVRDYNEMKNKYTKIAIDSNKSFLEKNEFLNDLYKNIYMNNNKINKKILSTKLGFLHLNEAKTESSIIKKYNIFKNRNSIKFNLNPKESEVLNIKVLNSYNTELKNVFQKHKDSIYEYKYKYNNIGNSLNTTKYHFNHFINKKYNFDSFDSLKTKRNINIRRRSLTFSLKEIKKIQQIIKQNSVNSLPDNSFPLLKTKPLYFKDEINWKNSNTNFLWIHKFILKDHYLDLNEENQCYCKSKEDNEIYDNNKKKKSLKKIVSDNNIKGFRTLMKQNSLIRYSPSIKTKSFSRSPSFIDLSTIRKNSMETEKKRERPKNINDFSLLSIKQFYNLKKNHKMKKYLEKDSLKNIEEVDDVNNNDESEDNQNIPFILQLKESDYKIFNKGEYLLENSRTIEDIYIGLSFLIVEGKEKLFINKIKELKNDIDINSQIMEGNTFLIMSTREGNKIITKFLCEKGCELNIQNFKGNTALHYAIANLFFEIVDILISFGAREDIINNMGLRPWECIDNKLD